MLAVPDVMAVVALEEPPPLGTLMVIVSWLAASVRVGAAEALGRLSDRPATARSAKMDNPRLRKLSLRLVRRKPKCQIRRLVTIRLRPIAMKAMVDEPVLAKVLLAPLTTSPICTFIVCVMDCGSILSPISLHYIYIVCAAYATFVVCVCLVSYLIG